MNLADEDFFLADDLFGALFDLLDLFRLVGFGDLVLDGLFFSGWPFGAGLFENYFGFDFLGDTLDEETLDLGCFLAGSFAEEVELGAADVALLLDFDFGDGGGLDGENFLDADIITGDPADDEGLQADMTTNGDDQALKNLGPGLIPFLKGLMNTNCVPDRKFDFFPRNRVCHIRHILTD